ncbi:MAG: divalent-cation tolerance protein CutA [Deltaproteobacteria bacterium]|nr:MAG: divalent-cation tolerance protein CutA [Deltaproteobacteria bacterium]
MLWVYMTFPDEDTAVAVGRHLVSERLAGCFNVLGSGRSVYVWEGALEEGREVYAVAKTTSERWPALEAAVVSRHPYACPCILAFESAAGHGPWLTWLSEAVGGGVGGTDR